jgi:anti-sigma regulatory factor (Ser/Thr protein kinase)
VTIRAAVEEGEIHFDIIDNGRHFDPSVVTPQTVEELIKQRRSGGLGLRLIRSIMDDVQYRIVPGEMNELRMTKRLKR